MFKVLCYVVKRVLVTETRSCARYEVVYIARDANAQTLTHTATVRRAPLGNHGCLQR